jgi:Tol biopolymer transport system component
MMKRLLVFTLLASLLAACLPQDTQIPQSPLLPLLERKSGLIAYIGIDGNMYVSDQAGGGLAQLTDDAVVSQSQGIVRYYQFPSWSKDGSQVAYVGLQTEGQVTETTLFVHNLDEETTAQVYASQTEYPFYLNWSPDNASVGFITTTARQNSIIFKTAPAAGGEGTVLDAGSPYYWSWAPDGSVLVAHSGSDESSFPAHLAFLRVDTGVTEYALDFRPASFQAPAWSPDGSRIALTRLAKDENQVIVTDGSGANPEVIGTFAAKTAFAWSFDGTKLAYLAADQALSEGTVGALHVHDLETSEETVLDANVAGFFWSPNGREIAYFIILPIPPEEGSENPATQYALQLNILDVASGASREVTAFLPTEQFLNILPYFDQYHQSATIWSPDNNNLVISFLANDGTPAIAIVPSSGTLEPRLLAPGYIAFWSWE